MNILLWILVSFGMATIVSVSKIFEPVRNWVTRISSYVGGFLACTMCMGFWTGVFLFGINGCTELFTFEYTLANALILGSLSSGTCYLLGVLINDFGFKVPYKDEGDCHGN